MVVCEVDVIPVSKAREILNNGGINVTIEQAAIILEFMMKLTRIAYENYFLETSNS
jgi:hypothetical protein